MNVWKMLGIAVFVVFVGIQFIRPEKTNPPVDDARTIQALTEISQDVATILERACRDCHSHNTVWPLHSYIAPVSWLVAHDVNRGRRNFNYSDWVQYNAFEAIVLLDKICNEVEDAEMPPKRYLLVHKDARLTVDDTKAICQWTAAEQGRYKQFLQTGDEKENGAGPFE